MKKLTTNEFISKARNVHGNKYSYIDVVYTNSREKVSITCPTHGNFEQSANAHLQGQGWRV